MTFEIGGVDMTPYIAFGGVKWQRNDIDSDDAGRTLDGTMIRNRQGIKVRLDITCRPLTDTEAATVLTAIKPEFVTVKYTDPMDGLRTSIQFYSNNVPATYLMKKGTKEYWAGIKFPLIEK